MYPRQKDMTSPKLRVSIPAHRRWAAMERPKGPAPITVKRQTDLGAQGLAPVIAGFTPLIIPLMIL
jgi:hypothetical protein